MGDAHRLRWLRAAALQGHVPAQSLLGVTFWERARPASGGRLNRTHLDTAISWLTPAARAGDLFAQYHLGRAYDDLRQSQHALHWYRQAAETGFVPAQLRAGLHLWRARDYEAALAFLRPAAEAGQRRALTYMGYAYSNGYAVPQDHRRAAAFWRRAAEAGDALGAERLAAAYQEGRGVPRNRSEALRWNRAAAELGSEVAARALSGDAMRSVAEEQRALGIAAAIVAAMVATGGQSGVGGGGPTGNPTLDRMNSTALTGMSNAYVMQ
jgi:hypothetical protein